MRPYLITTGIVILALLGLTVWGCFGLTHAAIVALDKWGDSAPTETLAKVDATLDAINAPCKDFQGNYTCGPIVQLSQTEKNVGILAARSAQQVQQTGVLVTAVANNLNTVGESVKDTASHLNKTADAATGTLDAATGTLGEGQRTLATFNAKAGPLLDAYTASGYDLDAILKANATEIHGTLVGIQGVATNTASITGSVDKMTAHLEKQVDSPKPLWKTMIPMSETAAKLYACLVQHVCVD